MKFHISKNTAYQAFLTILVAVFAMPLAGFGQSTTLSDRVPFDDALSAGPVYLVPVDGMIDNGLARYIERATLDAEEAEAALIIFHVDTFGGLVEAADKIRKTILNSTIPTVAFIDKNAASAGALISYAADRIIMAPGSSIGAATVVEGGTGAKASEKYQSYMRGLMRATAEANGRDPLIAESMVDDSLAVEGVVDVGELLTLSSQEAFDVGVADAIIASVDDIMATYEVSEAETIDHQASRVEQILRFLGSPVLQSILMLMMMGGLYFELQSPGVGFAGLMSMIGATLFFAPHYMLGLVESWEIVLFGIGVLLLIAEIFIIPGFGIAGLAGLVLVIGSLIASMIGNVDLAFPPFVQITSALSTMAVTLVLLGFMMYSLARYLPTSTRFNRMILSPELSSAEGYTAASTDHEILGMVGRALTPLRPSGTVQLTDNRQRVDVVTAGEFIDVGTAVRVVDVRGSRVEVRQVESIQKENETSVV
ncbi:MAG: nodulation protein NfeD [Rhodothermales bacterium]